MPQYPDFSYIKISKQMLKIIFDTLTAKKFIIAFDIIGKTTLLYKTPSTLKETKSATMNIFRIFLFCF